MKRYPLLLVAANIVTLIFALVMNGLANALPLNGRTTGQISDSFSENLFVPSGYVFAIWGVIYLLLIAFAVYQATGSGRRSEAVWATGWWFALSNIANGLWIVFWHYGFVPVTMVVMLVLLASLLAIATRLGPASSARSSLDRWLVYLPFSVYLGWISVATIANAAVTFLTFGWQGAPLNAVVWTILLVLVATALGMLMLFRRLDAAYCLVLIWALIGIALKQRDISPIPETAFFGVILLTVSLIAVFSRRMMMHSHQPA